MLLPRVLDKLRQDTIAADGSSHSTITEQLDVNPASDKLATLRVFRYATSRSSGPESITRHYHAIDVASFTGGQAVSGGFMMARLNDYINSLEDQAKGFLPAAEDIATA